MWRMHAEAVRRGGIPSMPGLIHDSSRAISCAECNASYDLHYDLDAEKSSTLCSILAAEIITARHPDHEPSFVLELPEQGTEKSKKEIAWSIRLDLGNLRKKRPDVI
jgi:hypothetical protein